MKTNILLSGCILSFLSISNASAWTVSQTPISQDESSFDTTEDASRNFEKMAEERGENKGVGSEPKKVSKNNKDPFSERAEGVPYEKSPYETLFNGVAAANVFEKKDTQLTDEELAISEYAQALEWINAGMETKAEQLLAASIKQCPEHTATRAELARLYLKKNRDEEADMLLSEGLQLSTDNTEFLKLMAMVMEHKETI
jgi:hypothetical protein